MKIILASQSPRRKELLLGLGYDLECVASNVEESTDGQTYSPVELAKYNAQLKGRFVYNEILNKNYDVIIAADTVVSLNGKIFGKPNNKQDAEKMLNELRGQNHTVSTGFYLINKRGQEYLGCVCSEVLVRNFYPEELKAYLASGESMGKAGSYAVQGVAAGLIKSINGSISNIIGLPIEEVIHHAKLLCQ